MPNSTEAIGHAVDVSSLMPTYPPPPVTFVRGEGSRLWDRDGNEYIDFLAGLAVTSLGHCHPAVADTLARQAHTLVHVSNLYATEPGPEVARTLDRLIGDGEPLGGKVFFCNSGAEANECAIKLARRWGGGAIPTGDGGWAGRYRVVSAHDSFHGRTLATLHATGQPAKHEPFEPLPIGFTHVPWCDLAALDDTLDDTVAAVLLEPVQGEGGVNPASADYFAGVRKLCDERGALFVVDEVQAGLGRTGRWFGHHHFDVTPDVVTVAKALGNGVPIGACWARADVAAAFKPGDHATTFGGQPLAAAAARTVLEVMQAEDVPARARRAGVRISAAVSGLPGVTGVRGLGLLLGVELDGINAREVAAHCLEAGLVVNPVAPTTVRLAPSLLIDDHDIDEGMAILGRVLGELATAEATQDGS